MAAVLYIDETGWESREARLLHMDLHDPSRVFCGKGRGGDVLDGILPKEFAGIAGSDNYSAYENRFSKHQKCWRTCCGRSLA